MIESLFDLALTPTLQAVGFNLLVGQLLQAQFFFNPPILRGGTWKGSSGSPSGGKQATPSGRGVGGIDGAWRLKPSNQQISNQRYFRANIVT